MENNQKIQKVENKARGMTERDKWKKQIRGITDNLPPDEKNNEAYRAYKNRTPALIPFPPPCYGCLPGPVKCLFCCEFPLYDHMSEENEKITVTKDMEAGNGASEPNV